MSDQKSKMADYHDLDGVLTRIADLATDEALDGDEARSKILQLCNDSLARIPCPFEGQGGPCLTLSRARGGRQLASRGDGTRGPVAGHVMAPRKALGRPETGTGSLPRP